MLQAITTNQQPDIHQERGEIEMNEIIDYRPYTVNDKKVYVKVSAFVDTEGNVYPISFIWEDGYKYKIDKISEIRPTASQKAEGTGMRYSIRVQNKQTYIWLEETNGLYRWFLEKRI